MGKPMASNIARAGFELTVCDLREEPCKALAALGARVVASVREVAEKSDIIEIAVVDEPRRKRSLLETWGGSWRASGINCGDSQHDPSWDRAKHCCPLSCQRSRSDRRAYERRSKRRQRSAALRIWPEVKPRFWKNVVRFRHFCQPYISSRRAWHGCHGKDAHSNRGLLEHDRGP